MAEQESILSIIKLFSYYKALGERAIIQINEEDFFSSTSELNSVSVLVNHMSGNMLSRWTNFPVEDGEKSWRNRDKEFEEVFSTREEAMERWNLGWECLFSALSPLSDAQLYDICYIRNEGHTILEAIHRQLGHYAYHVGQIVHICRVFRGDTWKSLSIPKGKSQEYNVQKFDSDKEVRHFTDRM